MNQAPLCCNLNVESILHGVSLSQYTMEGNLSGPTHKSQQLSTT